MEDELWQQQQVASRRRGRAGAAARKWPLLVEWRVDRLMGWQAEVEGMRGDAERNAEELEGGVGGVLNVAGSGVWFRRVARAVS
jgi:hypothetical protein